MAVIRDIDHRVEVLRYQHEDFGRFLHPGITQELVLLGDALHNLLALLGNTPTLQLLRFCSALGFFDHADLFRLRLGDGRLALALRRVNGVHGLAHAGIRADIGYQRIDEVPAVFGHIIPQRGRHVLRDGVLGGKGLIQAHIRHRRAHIILHIGHDLLLVVGQHIKGLALAALYDLVLHRDRNLDEDIILRLGFYHHVQLAHLQRNLIAHAVDPGHFEVQARVGDRLEFTQPFQDGRLAGTHDVVPIEYGAENQQDDDADDD